MERPLFLILQVVLCSSVSALFTVQVTRRSQRAQFGGNITMECTYRSGDPDQALSVSWRRVHPRPSVEVYRLEKWQEDLTLQDARYRGRVRLVDEELKNGRAVLEISDLRITDSGTYQCLMEKGGVDYKKTALTVRAPYKSLKKTIKMNGRGVELSCESQGYPLASVVWTDLSGGDISEGSNITTATTNNHLFNVTSTITVESSNNTYTCTFVGEGLMDQSVSFHIPDEIPEMMTEKSSMFPLMLAMILGVVAVCAAGVVYYRCKDIKQHIVARTQDRLIHGDYTPAHCAPDIAIEVHPQTPTHIEDKRVENLRALLRSRYARLASDPEASERLVHFCDEVLPLRLCSRDGLPSEVTALLPDVGESLLLEGGTKCVALALASSWAQNSEWDPFKVKSCQLVVVLTCAGATGDLFQEVMSQLGLDSELSLSDLREILSRPTGALLVLDGYQFGNGDLEASVREFLRRPHACRVLVTALPGHCASLREFFRTVLVLTGEG